MPTLQRTSKGAYQARKRIPHDVRADYKRLYGLAHEAKLFIPSTVPEHEARRRYGEWLSEYEGRIAAIRADQRGEGRELNQREALGLAGEWYQWFVAQHEDSPGTPESWDNILARQTAGTSAFSARGLETLSMLSRNEARFLEQLAPRTISLKTIHGETCCILTRLLDITFTQEPAGAAARQQYAEAYTAAVGSPGRDTLGPIGIMVEDGWAYDAVALTHDGACEFQIADQRYHVSGCPPHRERKNWWYFGAGVRYSAVGTEILSLIHAKPDAKMLQCMKALFEVVGLTLNEVAA